MAYPKSQIILEIGESPMGERPNKLTVEYIEGHLYMVFTPAYGEKQAIEIRNPERFTAIINTFLADAHHEPAPVGAMYRTIEYDESSSEPTSTE